MRNKYLLFKTLTSILFGYNNPFVYVCLYFCVLFAATYNCYSHDTYNDTMIVFHKDNRKIGNMKQTN